ncbi:MAG: hypothetical protein KDE33_24015 [Bacteroidetes bacterium]|nr:hypothetical protein [Bacteroidota bacterium]
MENQNQQNQEQSQSINIQIPSADNIASRRPLIPAAFAFALFCFFFTFCDLKCTANGQKLASVTGFELVTGTQLKDHDMMSGRETKGEKIPPSIWAILAFGAAVIGLGVFLIKEKREALVGTGAGAIGFCSLLILQFVAKSAIEKKTEGQLAAEFQFAYWVALLALGIAGWISYLRMKQTSNIVVNFTPPPQSIAENVLAESSITPQQVQSSSSPQTTTTSENGFDVAEWFKKNKKIAIGVITSFLVLFGVYRIFLKHDPERDGKSVAIAYCDCAEKANAGNIKANEEFLNSFSSYNFKKRQEARNKLEELKNPANTAQIECNNKAQIKYNELRNRYITNEEVQKKFDFAYTAQSGICNPSNQSKLNSMFAEIESKIATIKDPEPDIQKIKSDLIGKKIPGWNFDALSEFENAKISNTTHGSDRVEYTIDLHLVGFRSKDPHDAQILVTYNQGADGWYYGDVKEIFITYINTAPVNNWKRVTPLQNCTYSIIDNGQKFWVQDGSYGSKYKGGGSDGDTYYLRSSQIYIMSREDHPVDLVFKYTPKK